MNVQKVLWHSEERGVAYERVDAGGPFSGTDTPEYLGTNPNGLVPTISDGDFSPGSPAPSFVTSAPVTDATI